MSKSNKNRALDLFTQRVGLLNPNGLQGFAAVDVTNAPVRATREEAYQDWLKAYGMDD